MHSQLSGAVFFVLLLLFGVEAAVDAEDHEGPVDDDGGRRWTGYLAQHNALRSTHRAPPLTWSSTVAANAQAHADQCQLKADAKYKYGQNLFMARGHHPTPSQVLKQWSAYPQSPPPTYP